MALLPILKLPDPRLRLVSDPVGEPDTSLRALADDMLETMYAAPGIGLAAIQVGEPKRLIVLDLGKIEEERQPLVLLDPEVTWSSEETKIYEEGCLSIPDYYEEVERPERIRFRYRDLDGRTIEAEADGLLATCVQHEIDHLNGVLFLDHLSRLKREMLTKKFVKAAKREQADA